MMKLMSLKQYMGMSKPALIRKITKELRKIPKKRLAMVCYDITKNGLKRLSISTVLSEKGIDKEIKHLKSMGYKPSPTAYGRKRKTKRKFSRKQLAAQRLFAKRARAGTLRR